MIFGASKEHNVYSGSYTDYDQKTWTQKNARWFHIKGILEKDIACISRIPDLYFSNDLYTTLTTLRFIWNNLLTVWEGEKESTEWSCVTFVRSVHSRV